MRNGFFGFQKTNFGPVLDRRIKMPGIAGHEHTDAVVIFGHGGPVGVDKFFNLLVVVGLHPPRGI